MTIDNICEALDVFPMISLLFQEEPVLLLQVTANGLS